MKYFLQLLFVVCCLISFEAQSATVTNITNPTPINFGTIAPGSTAGTITSPCTTTSVRILSGCTNGSVQITATNTAAGAGPAKKDNGRKIKIFLTSSPTTLTSGSNSINSAAAIAAMMMTRRFAAIVTLPSAIDHPG